MSSLIDLGEVVFDLLAGLRRNLLGLIIGAAIVAVVVGYGYLLLAPRSGQYLVVHGDTCWVVEDRLHVNAQSDAVWWVDPQTGRTINVSGARYAAVPKGHLGDVARSLGARNCLVK